MTVEALRDALSLTPFAEPDPERTVSGGYTGDLLSWVMGHATSDEVWITIMSNRNIIAVATLTDVSLIILSEGVQPDEGVAELAQEKGINVYGSELSSYALSAAIDRLLADGV